MGLSFARQNSLLQMIRTNLATTTLNPEFVRSVENEIPVLDDSVLSSIYAWSQYI
jgi:hypothetical protein